MARLKFHAPACIVLLLVFRLEHVVPTGRRIDYSQPIYDINQNNEHQPLEAEEKVHQERSINYAYHFGGQSVTRRYDVVGSAYEDVARVCDVDLWQGEGNLSSYNYPFNYPNGVECVYQIPRVDFSTCALELTFHDFDVETDGVHCARDYLQAGVKRFCGRLRAGKKEIVEFPYNDGALRLKFKSDSVESGRGFWIEVRRKYSSCSSALVEFPPTLNVATVQGRLTSYGYPDYYRENMNCTYFIERQPGFCSVELEFVDFDVEGDSPRGCTKDYLMMEGIRYCGSILYGRTLNIDFRGRHQVALSFLADDHSGNRGFDIRYTQIACPSQPEGRVVPLASPKPACHYKYASMDVYIQSENYPSYYDNNLDCTYTIQRASVDVCELEFTFLNFDVEYDRLCRGDYLDINGGKICGPLPAKTTRRVRFYGSEMPLTFHSDNTHTGRGFEIMVRQKTDCSESASTRVIPYDPVGQTYCDEEKSSQEFYIQSTNFPHYYSSFVDCAYIIRKFSPLVCELQLTFLSFDLQDDRDCNYDYLEIDGQRYCGNAHHGAIKRFKFDNPEILVRFHSDRSSSGRGFQIFAQQRRDCEPTYRAISYPTAMAVVPVTPAPPPPSCDAVFSSSEFRLRSLNYPGNYDNNMNCVLRILRTSSHVCELQLIFNAFDLEDDAGCRYDYLEINSRRMCGFIRQGTVNTIPFDGSEMIMRFSTDHTNSRPGFDITIQQKMCVPSTTPHPVLVTKIHPVIVDRPVFVEKPIYVEKPVIVEQPIPRIIPTTPVEYPITYNVPSTGCDQVFTTWEFFFQSVHFPLNYGNNVDCTYRAQKFSLSVCEIELHFMSFDTEGHPDCAKDYLEVEGERFCGTITPGTIRRYRFDKPEFVIRFHSDHENSGVGYNILVRQKTSCPAAAPANVVAAYPVSRMVYVPSKTTVVSTPVHYVVPQATVAPVFDFQLSQPSSQFASLNYPGYYGENINCTYRIARAKDVCAVQLYFNDFDLQSSADCRRDYLTFGGKRYCSNELKGQTRMLYFEHSNEAVMNFVTDNAASGKGWWCFYRQVPCSEVATTPYIDSAVQGLCEHSFQEESGFIKSRNYPLALYASNEDCYYRIQRFRQDVCSVELTFTDFSLEPSTNCERDYLEIDRRRYCGTSLQRKTLYLNFPVGSDDLLLHFKSNGDREDRGFFVQVRQLSYGCSRPANLPAVPLQYRLIETRTCNVDVRSAVSTIQSPAYPSSYPPNSDCTYTVVKSSPAVCGLQLVIPHFSVESSQLCRYDYLQTPMGDRMCGTSWTGVKRTVPFPIDRDRLVFVFHSDTRNEDQGFSIDVRQITTGCP